MVETIDLHRWEDDGGPAPPADDHPQSAAIPAEDLASWGRQAREVLQQSSEYQALPVPQDSHTEDLLQADLIQADGARTILALLDELWRLKEGRWLPAEVNDLCHNLHRLVDAREFADGCAAEQRKLYRCAPDADLAEKRWRLLWHARAVLSTMTERCPSCHGKGELQIIDWESGSRHPVLGPLPGSKTATCNYCAEARTLLAENPD